MSNDLFRYTNFPDEPAEFESAEQERDALQKQVGVLVKNVAHLLKQIGEPALCSGCGVRIWFVRHLNGKRVPYTSSGLNHFADCPEAQKFRKVRTT